MSYGLKPLISDWVGAKGIYGDYVFKNISSLKRLLKHYDPIEYQNWVKKYYNLENTYRQIDDIIKN